MLIGVGCDLIEIERVKKACEKEAFLTRIYTERERRQAKGDPRAGNLGQAIANYTNFEKRGFMIKGMFDINPRLIGLVVRGVEIRGIDDLEQFIVDNEVQIAALTIPKSKVSGSAALEPLDLKLFSDRTTAFQRYRRTFSKLPGAQTITERRHNSWPKN